MTVFDDDTPAVANLDPALLAALREAATAAAGDRVVFHVNSGWRSVAYQEQLLDEAVSTYGSRKAAARWVATPDTSAHVSGDAVDIGPDGCRGLAVRPRRRLRAVPDLPERALALRAAPRRGRAWLPGRVCRPVARPADEPVTRPPAGRRLAALFVVYLVLLGWVVLWKLEVPWVGRAARGQARAVRGHR